MKSHLFLCWAAVAALALCAACSDDAWFGSDTTLAKPQPLVFVAAQDVLTATPETRAAADGTWVGDGTELVAIQIGDEVKKYKVTSTSGTLQPYSDNDIFYRTDKSDIAITAWYPYSSGSEPDAPTISIDQSTDQESSNLMKATATAEYGKSTTLAFSHQAARLRFHLYKEGSDEDLTGATVKVSITDGSTQTEYTAHEDGGGYYSVLVAPGATVSSGADFLSITVSGAGTYKATAPAAATFAVGTLYNYDFNLLGRIPYVTFKAASEQGFNMKLPSNANGYSMTFEYSVGDGDNWTTVTSGEEVTFGGTNGDLRLRGKSSFGTASSSTNYSTISFTKDVDVAASGDIRTLVDYTNYSTAATTVAGFAYLFKDCTQLTSAPELPTTKLTNTQSYYGMFYGCTALTSAPALPATSLTTDCYNQMFKGCTALTSAPTTLQATTLARECYQQMFEGCTNLKTAPALPATKLTPSCYYQMFKDCTSLETAPKLEAESLESSCYREMFSGCTKLETAPALPATTLKNYCYRGMFYNCTGLTSAPTTLSAETLAEQCYYEMFSGCTNLTTVPTTLPATKLEKECYREMFSGCKSLKTAPEIKATTLATSSCQQMFYQCTSLTKAPTELLATTLTASCYYGMFYGCTSLETAPTMSATTLAESCCYWMFYGCTSLTKAPVLLATTLVKDCYRYMFYNCKSLTEVTIKAEGTIPTDALTNWLYGVASQGTVYKKSSLTLPSGASGIPSGWTDKDLSELSSN